MTRKIIIYTIPKCGTHFLSQIVALLLNINCNIYDKKELYKYVDHIIHASQIKNKPYFNTHPKYVNYQIMKKAPHFIIFSIRNPIDKTISNFFYNYYNRLNLRDKNIVDKNFNKVMFNWCNKNIQKYSNEIIKHMNMQKYFSNSILIDYNKLNSNKIEHIKLIANIMKVPYNDELIQLIYDKTDVKKCRNYEKNVKLFKVGKVQHDCFFRDGTNEQFYKYFTHEQIKILISKIPLQLKLFYNLNTILQNQKFINNTNNINNINNINDKSFNNFIDNIDI